MSNIKIDGFNVELKHLSNDTLEHYLEELQKELDSRPKEGVWWVWEVNSSKHLSYNTFAQHIKRYGPFTKEEAQKDVDKHKDNIYWHYIIMPDGLEPVLDN